MDILFRDTEGADPQPYLLWDTVWTTNPINLSQNYVDWVLAGPTAPLNNYGLASSQSLNTAILLALFTWRRAEASDTLPSGSDPQGWWGDDVDLQDGETLMGSRLWLLRRAPLNANTERLAVNYAYEALQPLVDQGAVATFTVTATADKVKGYLGLQVNAYSQDGTRMYSQQFENIWSQEFPS